MCVILLDLTLAFVSWFSPQHLLEVFVNPRVFRQDLNVRKNSCKAVVSFVKF